MYKLTINFFNDITKFFPNYIYKKYIPLVSLKSFLYTLISGQNNFFGIFVTNQIFKTLLTERKLIRCDYFINIYIVYENRVFTLMKFIVFNFSIIKLIKIFLSIFICDFDFYIYAL